MQNTTWAEKIGKVHLVYLSLMPAVGTFALFVLLDTAINPMVFFLLGTAAIGVYLAFTGSFTVITSSPWRNFFMLIDGPLWIGLTVALGGSVATALVNGMIVEIAGVLLGVIGVTLTSTLPTFAQRRASLVAVGLPLIGVGAVLAIYAGEQGMTWLPVAILVAAALQSAWVEFALGSKMAVQRPSEWLILTGILAWMGTLFLLYPIATFVLGL